MVGGGEVTRCTPNQPCWLPNCILDSTLYICTFVLQGYGGGYGGYGGGGYGGGYDGGYGGGGYGGGGYGDGGYGGGYNGYDGDYHQIFS